MIRATAIVHRCLQKAVNLLMKGKDGPTVTSTGSSGSTACKDTAYKAGPLLRALTTAALMTLPQLAEV
jgi:hypothetical protein